jgi:hypothetical protein
MKNRKTIASAFIFATLAIVPAQAQQPQHGPNTVQGRLGIGPGPSQDIPFGTLLSLLLGGSPNTISINGSTVTLNGALTSTANASLSNTFSGVTVLDSIYYNLTAAASGAAVVDAVFRMTSGVGGSNVSHFKAALGIETITNAGSAPMWAFSSVNTANSGYAIATQGFIGFEGDTNNLTGTNCVDEDPGSTGHYCAGFVLTGAGSYQISAGIIVGGYSKFRSGVEFQSGGPVANDIISYDSSQVLINDLGTHLCGLDGSAATYIDLFIVGPSNSFNVSGAGVIGAGTWHGGVIGAAYGGTGEANNAANTITFSGNYGLTLTLTWSAPLTVDRLQAGN